MHWLVAITEIWKRAQKLAGIGHRARQGGGLPEADVVEGLVVDADDLVGVLDELVDGEGGIVRLHYCVRHLRRRHDGEGERDPVGVLIADFGDQERAHSRSRASTEGVGHLETLQAVRGLNFLTNDIEDGINQLCSLLVMTLCPVVFCSSLSKHKIIWPKYLTIGSCANRVHGSWL